jgi:CRP-like cAMP-binding protein
MNTSNSVRERSDSYLKAMLQQTEAKPMADFEKLRFTLRAHPWLSSHTDVQIDDVARFMKLTDAQPLVYTRGDNLPDASFYVVKSGEFLETTDDDSLSTRKLKDWSTFGESALRFKGPRTETVRLISEKGELYSITASAYQHIIVKEQILADRGAFGFLRSVELLQQLTDEQIHVLSKCLERKTYKPGEKIIEQNTKGTEFFFLEKGCVRADQHTKKGDKDVIVKVNQFKAGDYFGEGAMLRDEPRSADCVVEGDQEAVTLVLRKSDFVELLGGLGSIVEANFIARVLRAVELLQGLTDAEVTEIASSMTVEDFAAGEVVMRQGEEGDKLYIIKDGEVVFTRRREGSMIFPGTNGGGDSIKANGSVGSNKDSPTTRGSRSVSKSPQHRAPETLDLMKDGGSGDDAEIGRLFTGQVFGEGALLTNAPRRATAKAVTNVTLLSLERNVFHRLFKESLQDLLNRDFTKRRDLDEQNRKDLMEFKDLAFIDLLGVGTYGQVLLVSHKVTGQTYALKCMSKQRVRDMDQREHVENERKILSMINHPFVVNLVQTFTSKDHVFALTEAVLGGELFAYLRTVGRLRPKDARFYMAQIVLAFEYLHSLNVVYRDLKPENLLVMPSGFIKMADFGLAKVVPAGESTYTLCGTPAYAAPEVYNMKGHGKAVDWWGLGVLCHELISGATPFDGDAAGIFDAMQRYSRAFPNIRLPRRLDGSVAGDLVLKLLHPNPAKRLGGGGAIVTGAAQPLTGARAVKAHSFFDDLSWADLIKMNAEVPYKPQIAGGYDTRNFYEPAIGNDVVVDLANVDPSMVVAGMPWEL